MINNSFPFRSSQNLSHNKSSHGSQTIDERKLKNNKKRQSLQINTSTEQQQDTTSPNNNKVRQRLSSLLFRTSSPVVMTLKETFSNKRASLSTVSFSNKVRHSMDVEEEEEEDAQSTTTTLSSNSSDHMPASPKDARAVFDVQQNGTTTTVWQPSVTVLSFTDSQQESNIERQDVAYYKSLVVASPAVVDDTFVTPTDSAKPPKVERTNSLAYQVQQILGSTLDQVDEEIDQDWEMSRDLLSQSLVLSPRNNRQQWIFS